MLRGYNNIVEKIDIIVPCYNEEKSVEKLYINIKNVFEHQLSNICFTIIFVDDYSTDSTRDIIRKLCTTDSEHVRAIFNATNFGFSRNVFQSLQYSTADAAFLVFGDMQDPPELLPEFIKKWNHGEKLVVIGQKRSTEEGVVITAFRKMYYRLINLLSDRKQISQFNGYGLYDARFIDVLRQVDDLEPYLKQVISEYGGAYETVEYDQNNSLRGKSNFNFYRNYDFAMQGVTSSTKKLLRIPVWTGAVMSLLSIIYSLFVLIKKIVWWEAYTPGTASILIGIFLLGGIQLFFIGILGEYILTTNARTQRRPRVVVGEKINFEE